MNTSKQYEDMCKARNNQQREVKFRYTFRLQNGQIVTEPYTLYQLENVVICSPLLRWYGMIIDAILARDEWTGLEDNNKIEIYENDNIQFKYLNEIRVAKVVITPGYGAHLDDERGTRLQYALNHGGVVVSEVEE